MQNVHDLVLVMQVNYDVKPNEMVIVIHVYLMIFVVVEQLQNVERLVFQENQYENQLKITSLIKDLFFINRIFLP
jgi:hypothetical protein